MMKTRYQPLCQLTLQHRYYHNHHLAEGLRIWPTAACQRLLDQHYILFRQTDTGCTLFVAVVAKTKPPQLLQTLNSETLRLSFWLEVSEPLLLNVSALSSQRLGHEIFYVNNLADHRTVPNIESPLYLNNTDSTFNTLGDSLHLVTHSVYNYRFTTPTSNTTLRVKDPFNTLIKTIPLTLTEPTTEYRLNLSGIQRMVAGRYTVSDDQGGSHALYFAPELIGKPVLGLIELYNSTKNLTADHSEHVPNAYRFLSATNHLTQISAYTLKFNHRKTIRRYIITKKYNNNNIDLNELSVKHSHDNTFNFSTTHHPQMQQIIFTANRLLPLQESEPLLELHRPDPLNPATKTIKFRDLPSPTLLTPLQQPSGLTDFSSDIYIYV